MKRADLLQHNIETCTSLARGDRQDRNVYLASHTFHYFRTRNIHVAHKYYLLGPSLLAMWEMKGSENWKLFFARGGKFFL